VANIAGDKAEGKGKGAENQGLQGMKNKTMGSSSRFRQMIFGGGMLFLLRMATR